MAENSRGIGEQTGELARSMRGAFSKAEEIGDRSIEKGAELAAGIGHKADALADRVDEASSSISGHVRGVAGKVNQFADDLHDKKTSDVLQSAIEFGRAHPLMMMAGAGLLGFALARFLGAGGSSRNAHS